MYARIVAAGRAAAALAVAYGLVTVGEAEAWVGVIAAAAALFLAAERVPSRRERP